MNNTTFKRIGAYAIDYIFIVLFLTMLNQIRFLNPTFDEYAETYSEYMEIYEDLSVDNAIEIAESEEYQKINYNLSKYSISISCLSIAVYLAYFVGFQKWNKNQTLGKKLFNIEVASTSGNNVKWWQMLLRTIVLYNIIFEVLLIIAVLVFGYKDYMIVSGVLSVLASIIFYVNIFFIILRKDGRGLHDIIAGTKIVERVFKDGDRQS